MFLPVEKILKKSKGNKNYKIPENLFVAEDIILKQIDIIKSIIYPNGFTCTSEEIESKPDDQDKVNLKKIADVLDGVSSSKKIRLTLPLKNDSEKEIDVIPVIDLSPELKRKTPEKAKPSHVKTGKISDYLTPRKSSDSRETNFKNGITSNTKIGNRISREFTKKSPNILKKEQSPSAPSLISKKPIQSTSTTSTSSSMKPSSSPPKKTLPSTSTSSADTKPTGKPPPNQKRNFPKIEDVFKVVAPKGFMAKKLEKAAPYNIFFTTITASKPTHSEPLSVTFQELLDPSLGDLESSIQINFMVDIGFLMAHYIFSGNENKPMVILYGQDSDDLNRISTRYPEISAIKIQMNGAFGTHHTLVFI